ncbi:MAG: hypothetical protein ACK5OB_18455 [Pirellula sp.]
MKWRLRPSAARTCPVLRPAGCQQSTATPVASSDNTINLAGSVTPFTGLVVSEMDFSKIGC